MASNPNDQAFSFPLLTINAENGRQTEDKPRTESIIQRNGVPVDCSILYIRPISLSVKFV